MLGSAPNLPHTQFYCFSRILSTLDWKGVDTKLTDDLVDVLRELIAETMQTVGADIGAPERDRLEFRLCFYCALGTAGSAVCRLISFRMFFACATAAS
jgi:hypothetical protein